MSPAGAASSGDGSGGGGGLSLIVAAAAGSAVVIAIAVVILRRRKSEPQHDGQKEELAQPGTTEAEDVGNSAVLLILDDDEEAPAPQVLTLDNLYTEGALVGLGGGGEDEDEDEAPLEGGFGFGVEGGSTTEPAEGSYAISFGDFLSLYFEDEGGSLFHLAQREAENFSGVFEVEELERFIVERQHDEAEGLRDLYHLYKLEQVV